jgi:hypothetical protein
MVSSTESPIARATAVTTSAPVAHGDAVGDRDGAEFCAGAAGCRDAL